MPAVTVDDLTVLPRLRTPGLGDQPRPVWQLTTAPQGYEGEGFPVRPSPVSTCAPWTRSS